jgi:hypothetical protein
MTGAKRALAAATRLCAEIQAHGPIHAPALPLDPAALIDRSDALPLGPAGLVSPNGACRLVAARDGWLAVNLPRDDDAALVPAWLRSEPTGPVWPAVAKAARVQDAGALVERAAGLGLAVSRLGEAAPRRPDPIRMGGGGRDPGRRARVLDLSSLWAGPLCAAILAGAGHAVTKVESRTRPDPVPLATPLLDARLNGAKARRAIAFTPAELAPLMAAADVIVTSARPRAFADLGLAPERLFAANPGLVWVAITAHGWTGPGAGRIGFGDDAAVAGGLVDWQGTAPRFAGDALADPLTGLAAGSATLAALAGGGGVLIDAALAPTAALAQAGWP